MAMQMAKTSAMLRLVAMSALCVWAAGCASIQPAPVPNEWNKTAGAEYTISPPDILVIDALNLIPIPPYKIAPLDGLVIRVTVVNPGVDQKANELLPRQPIDGVYRVEADGYVNLGFSYGPVQLGGLTIEKAQKEVTLHLEKRFKEGFIVSVALWESRALQQIRGEHLVRQDGMITLGVYGEVYVGSMTVPQAKKAIEAHLSKFLMQPEISLDVTGYNSQVYYVIVDLDGAAEQVLRLPVTGNQTVLDAISEIRGLPAGTDRKRIVLSRRTGPDDATCQVYPVDWEAITRCGSTATNYQIFAGDRIYVGVNCFVAADSALAKFIAPFERIFGVVLLGASTIQEVSLPLGGGTTTTVTR
jgi:polysaccharide biosynthesis/export protein